MKQLQFTAHLAAAIIISGIILFIYASVQQVHRSVANDPQLQIARDMRNEALSSKSLNHWINNDTIDAATSSAVFYTFYDNNGKPVETSALLDGRAPQVPKGILDFARQNQEDVVTWQPREGVRLAMVVEHIQGVGYAAVGRSLRETEERTGNLVNMMLITWTSCMAILALHFVFTVWINRKMKTN